MAAHVVLEIHPARRDVQAALEAHLAARKVNTKIPVQDLPTPQVLPGRRRPGEPVHGSESVQLVSSDPKKELMSGMILKLDIRKGSPSSLLLSY